MNFTCSYLVNNAIKLLVNVGGPGKGRSYSFLVRIHFPQSSSNNQLTRTLGGGSGWGHVGAWDLAGPLSRVAEGQVGGS